MLGTAVGVLPGIGPAMTVALLLPVTFSLEPTTAFIMFAGIYYGGMYGGSTTSILLNTPGESASIMTALEGNKMARAGRGAAALATAAIGSFVAGTHRDARPGVRRAAGRRLGGLARPGGLLRAGDHRVRRGVDDLGHLAAARPGLARPRPLCRRSSAPTCSPGRPASRSTSRSSTTASTWSWLRWGCSPLVRRSTSPACSGTAERA